MSSYESAQIVAGAVDDIVTNLNKHGLPGLWDQNLYGTHPNLVNYDSTIFPVVIAWMLTSGKASSADIALWLLKELGYLNLARFDPMGGNGVFYDFDGEAMNVIKLWNSDNVESVRGVHLGMLMQGVGDLVVLPAGNYPYTDCIKLMKALFHSI